MVRNFSRQRLDKHHRPTTLPQPALAYKQERQSPKAPRKKKCPLILTNRVIFFILIFLIKPKY